MFPHCRDQHLVGEFEKFLVEFACYGDRVLNQVVDNIHQFFIGQNAAADFLCRCVDLAFYRFTTFSKVNDHFSRLQAFQIIIG